MSTKYRNCPRVDDQKHYCVSPSNPQPPENFISKYGKPCKLCVYCREKAREYLERSRSDEPVARVQRNVRVTIKPLSGGQPPAFYDDLSKQKFKEWLATMVAEVREVSSVRLS